MYFHSKPDEYAEMFKRKIVQKNETHKICPIYFYRESYEKCCKQKM
jgi:hypothetical protein